MWSRSPVRARSSAPSPSSVPCSAGSPASGSPCSFIGRVAETEAIVSAVRHPSSAGAVVVGAPGMGKSFLLQHVERVLEDSHVVPVRGVASAASFPFRALSFLISEVPSADMHPALVVNAVAKHLRQAAGGRRIVLAVDNAEHLDESSATLIGQLIAGQVVSVILTVTDFAQADASFMAMWRTSALRRIDLTPLTEQESQLLVESRLGGPASREVTDAVWAVGAGHPRAMRAALNAYTERGLIARRGTVHVLLRGTQGTGQDVVAQLPLLGSLTSGQRAVVDLLALAGPLAWTDLAQDTDPADVDALQDAGLLVIDSLAEPRASLVTAGLSEAVAGEVGQQQAADLLQRIESIPAARQRLHGDPARFVVWALLAGRPVDDAQATAAAAALIGDGEYGRALQLAEGIGAESSAGLALQALVAAAALGQIPDATVHAATLARMAEGLAPREFILYKIEESRLRRLSSASGAGPAEPLDDAEHELDRWRTEAPEAPDGEPGGTLEALALHLTIARAEVAAFEGRHRDVPALLDGIDLTHAADTPEVSELSIARDALALEANMVMNRQSAVGVLDASLAGQLARPGVSFTCADRALIRVGLAYLASGRTGEGSSELAGIIRSSDRWSFRRGSLATVAHALLLLLQDRTSEAATSLVPAVEQLRIADPHGVLPLADAVLSYCTTLSGSFSLDVQQPDTPGHDVGGAWLVGRAAEHYRLLASALQGNRAEAALVLQDRASTDLAYGADAWALVSLAAAVRLGREECVVELRELADRLDGEFAHTYGLYAGALLESDTAKLLEAMASAAATGNVRLVADIAQSGINLATRNQDRRSLRLIQRRLRELVPEPEVTGAPAGRLDGLTEREREVAVLAAAGHSNRVIATQMFVSVRTVEGHLYQVYSKLDVSTRAELSALLPSESTA